MVRMECTRRVYSVSRASGHTALHLTRVGCDANRSVSVKESVMLKGIQWFMERLVERVVPTVASSFMSTLQTMHVLGQAEQQDQIEEVARRYEAEGKTELAARLRRRSDELTSETPGESEYTIGRCVFWMDADCALISSMT